MVCLVLMRCLMHLLDRHGTDTASLQQWHSVTCSQTPNPPEMPLEVSVIYQL